MQSERHIGGKIILFYLYARILAVVGRLYKIGQHSDSIEVGGFFLITVNEIFRVKRALPAYDDEHNNRKKSPVYFLIFYQKSAV